LTPFSLSGQRRGESYADAVNLARVIVAGGGEFISDDICLTWIEMYLITFADPRHGLF
jgi:hypothetical protein